MTSHHLRPVHRSLPVVNAGFPGYGRDSPKNDIGQNIVRLAFAAPADVVKNVAQPELAWSWYDFDFELLQPRREYLDGLPGPVGRRQFPVLRDRRPQRLPGFVGQQGEQHCWPADRPDAAHRDSRRSDQQFALHPAGDLLRGDQVADYAGHARSCVLGFPQEQHDADGVLLGRSSSTSYLWRDVGVRGWPNGDSGGTLASKAPDFADWLNMGGIGNHILGATRRNDEIWFAWTAHSGNDGRGGFSFTHPHVQIAKIKDSDFSLIDQVQIWNGDHAYAYPSLATNTDGEVGVSLAWGGGNKYYGSHAVGLMGDFVVWYPEASELTLQRQVLDSAGNPVKDSAGNPVMQTRWGDYVTARRISPNGRLFGGFGYAVRKDASVTGKADPYYILFGRNSVVNPGPPPVR